MAKFKFRLATLRKLREAARDERRAELADAYQAEEVLLQQRYTLDSEIDQLRLNRRKAVEPGVVDVDNLLGKQRFELILLAQRAQLEQQRQQVAEEVARRRQLLIEADREVKVLDKLEEKQLDRHRQAEALTEIKQFDEIAGRRAAEASE